MTRKDSEKDADRPHYYSQFWLDIAAGRRVIGGPKPEETEAHENEAPEPPPARKTVRASDGYKETRASAVVEPVVEEEEFEPEEVFGEVEQPDIDLEEEVKPEEEEIEPETDLIEEEGIEMEEEEDFFEGEEGEGEGEEEEEETEWERHGRKKPKPGRLVKQPVKKTKRDTRRSF